MRRAVWLSAMCLLFAASAQAAPVTGWFAVHPTTGAPSTKPLANAHTSSPILGDGSADSAAMVALYADISGLHDGAADVALANGQQVTLSGSATLSGINSNIEQFRWGLFHEASPPFDAFEWRGYIASNSAGNGGGALRAKDSEPTTTFAQTGSATNLQIARDGGPFVSGTYDFSITVSRYNEEVVINASLTSAEGWSQQWQSAVVASPIPLTYDFNRVGFLSGNPMRANQISFSNIDVSVTAIDSITLQVTTSGASAGAMEIRNDQSSNFEIDYYEISSAAGSLNVAGWQSLSDQDPEAPEFAGWVAVPNSHTGLLSEFRLLSTMTVAPQASYALGNAFSVGAAEDLSFYFGLADGTLVRGVVEYVSGGPPGDYNGDGVVDAADYVRWRTALGQTVFPGTGADGDLSGTIDAGDYAVWRSNYGISNPVAAFGSQVVPEPTTYHLIAIGLLWLTVIGNVRANRR